MIVSNKGTLILSDIEIRQKIKRLAFEILENNIHEEDVMLVGLQDKGEALAKLLYSELKKITSINIHLSKLSIDKYNVHGSEVKLELPLSEYQNKVIILIDDVINTATTVLYSLRPFLEIPVKKIEIAVLVNRSHTQFPITPTYTGLELATTLDDHIDCSVTGNELSVYLN